MERAIEPERAAREPLPAEVLRRGEQLALALPGFTPSGRSKRGSHQLSGVRTCEAYWDLRYFQRMVQNEDKDYRMGGTLAHLMLEYHYAAMMPAHERPAWFTAQDLRTAAYKKGEGYPSLIDQAFEMLVAYRQFFPTEPWRPLTIEQEFFARVGDLDMDHVPAHLRQYDNEVVSCRPDLIVEMLENDPVLGRPLRFIFDYKTLNRTTTYRSNTLEKWNPNGEYLLNWQVLYNLHVVRQSMAIDGFVIQRMKRKGPWDAGSFDRNIIDVAKTQLAYDKIPREIRCLVRDEAELTARLTAGEEPRHEVRSCWTRYGACDYRPLCSAPTKEIRASRLATSYEKEE